MLMPFAHRPWHPIAIVSLALMQIAGMPSCTAGNSAPVDLLKGTPESHISHIWANTGEDKVTQDELRAQRDPQSTINSVWDGRQVTLFGARNETVACNLILEAVGQDAIEVSATLESLQGSGDAMLTTRPASPDADLFNFVGRNIELFYVRYLPIKGISLLAYDHYDERHIPQRLRRPFEADGRGYGKWQDRPDHDKFYPDIAVPLELHPSFTIQADRNQSLWVDITIPRNQPPGTYRGTLVLRERGEVTWRVPIVLEVPDFALPDLPTARTMLCFSKENVARRYLGVQYPEDAPDADLIQRFRTLQDRHFQLAHRHRISPIDGYIPVAQMDAAWRDRLSGALFTPERGYSGPGEGVGNNVYSIGTYGNWPWKEAGEAEMHRNSDAWVRWFESQKFQTPTAYFLYLIDESSDFPQIEQWSQWVDSNPGPGRRLQTLATVPAPKVREQAPSLDLPTSTFTVGVSEDWQRAVEHYRQTPGKRLWMYNGYRPASGTLLTEDDGVALREVAWGQYKMQIERWFVWESTYYNNFQGGQGETNVFQQAHTFGGRGRVDEVFGETGWNYNNGDGVLFYPGTDTVFPAESYGLPGPIASLRLKHWRRGLQDVEYLTLAAAVDSAKVAKIVNKMVPRILWELGVDDPNDPTWVRTDISWSTNPDDWEAARRQLADIVQRHSQKGEQ
jgi:hypothetical protein